MTQAGRKAIGPERNVRVGDDAWSRFELSAAAADLADAAANPATRRHRIDRSTAIRSYIDWFNGDTDELPPRPTPEQLAELAAARASSRRAS